MHFLDIFLHDLLRQAWFTNPADFGLFIEDLKPLLIQRLFLSTITKLSEEQKIIAEQKIEQWTDSFHAYCSSIITNYDAFIGEVCAWFAQDYLDWIAMGS